MRGNLQDEQAAMRARQQQKSDAQPNTVQFRTPTEEEERLFLIEDLERELRGLKTKRRTRRIPITLQDILPPAGVKVHGNRWSTFGTANAESTSPVRASIHKWGLKIKAQKGEE